MVSYSGSSRFSGILKSGLWNDFFHGLREKNNFTHMKKYLLLLASVLLFAACSTPKYAYYFDHYDYNSGKKKIETPKTQLSHINLATPEMSPLQLDEQAVPASAESRIKPTENTSETLNQKDL